MAEPVAALAALSMVPDFYVNRTLWPASKPELQHRVVLVTNSYDRNLDGVALTLNRLVAHLMRRGHEVLVVVPMPGRRQRIPVIRSPGAEIVTVPSVSFPLWSEYRLTWRLGRTARSRLAAFAPTVMHIAIQDGLGHAAQSWARAHKVPVVCSHHTRFERYLHYYQPLRPFALRLEEWYWWGMRRFHSGCEATLPPSESLASDLEAHGVPRVGVWHRGVDRTLFNAASRSEVWREGVGDGDESTPIVLLVARLRWEKGLRAFAAVVSELGLRGVPVRVAVVGDGPAPSLESCSQRQRAFLARSRVRRSRRRMPRQTSFSTRRPRRAGAPPASRPRPPGSQWSPPPPRALSRSSLRVWEAGFYRRTM